MPLPDFTVCVLLYGDYPALAAQCLEPLMRMVEMDLIDLRIGVNEISAATDQVLRDTGAWECVMVREEVNAKKYPVMRKLFSWKEKAISTPYTMWFDDDSYIREGTDISKWLGVVKAFMHNWDMIGWIHTQGLEGNQAEWMKVQPWYTGASNALIHPGHRVRFATGGWWTARTDILRKFDWPLKDLLHRGGDVMLGELCRQQNFRLGQFKDGVEINTEKKRGFDSRPIGWDYKKQ